MARRDKINTAIVGCGAFVKGFHLPNMARDGRYRVHAVVDVNAEAAEAIRKEYGAAYCTPDYDRALNDKDVDLVVITTRHNMHADMATRAARAGKHILCEKPMGITYDECRSVLKAVRESGVKYCIGYNRGMAPLVRKAGEILRQQNRPVVIYHRIQCYFRHGEFHWILEEKEGGGRLVSEGCHIFDLFCCLANSEPIRVYAEGGIFTNSGKIHTPDTAVITVAFENGSVATMCIPSVGNSQVPKEATEAYCGNVGIVIDNFEKMTACVGAQKEVVALESSDKGHAVEIGLLADCLLNGAPLPNSPESAARSALLAFKAIDAIREHKVMTISRDEYAL